MARSSSKSTNKESAVTDTETAPEATDAPTEAPAEAKAPIDHEGNLYAAITAFASDQDVAKLQEAYREVPAAARGKVQGVAMKRAMTEGGVDMDVLGAVLDAFNNLPAATKSRASKPQVDEPTLNALRLAGLMVGYDELRKSLGEEAHAQAAEWYANGAPEEHVTLITKIAAASVAAASKGGRGGSGTRTGFSEKVADLIARGALSEGSVLKGANGVEASVNADGTVTSDGQTFDNLSAAAKHHRPGKDGKATSTNGWDFWQFDGKPVGDLRKS